MFLSILILALTPKIWDFGKSTNITALYFTRLLMNDYHTLPIRVWEKTGS